MRIRTGYSFKTAIGHTDSVLKRLMDIGWKVAPITDRVSTYGFNRYTKACKKLNLRPIYGVELGVVASLGEKKPSPDYWTFIAKDELLPLHRLIGLATQNVGREPSITYEQALDAEGLIKIAGNAVQLSECDADDPDLFLGLSPSIPRGLFKMGQEGGFKWMAVSDNVYPNEEDREFYRVTLGRRASTQSYPQHILSDKEWMDAVDLICNQDDMIKALDNRDRMITKANASLKKATLLIPKRPKTLRKLCEEGAKRVGIDLKDKVYGPRLERELRLIKEKQFEDYFYIICDMVQWAKKRMVVGPARGSSCGSLACYLLDITTIDPIPYDLLFERFIDTTRTDLPDIDIDFSDNKRHLVFEYAEKKYGVERVARLGTIGLFKPRSALNAASMALQIPKWKMNKVLDSIIERSSGDARAMQAVEDTLKDTEAGRSILEEYPEILIAAKIDSHPNAPGQHAAGIVITEEPIINYVAIDSRTKSIMCDGKDAEDYNFLKIDALGLTQLSIFERTLELIGQKPTSENRWLEKLPRDDQKAFDVLNKAQFSGIFQFNGLAIQSLVKSIVIEDIEDIISIIALARPGPMSTGRAQQWVRRRMNQEEFKAPHPIFEPYLRPFLGIVMYQETVMKIGKDIGDLTWEDVTQLRKAMSKSLGKEFFDRYGDKWKAAGERKGIPRDILDVFWDDLCSFGSYGFNRSHAVAYGMVSYYSCYLKAHYPLEFAAATLDAESNPGRQILMLRELREEGIDYVPVDPETSTDKWVPKRRGNQHYLVGPLTQIKGFGPATVAEIVEARRKKEPIRPVLQKRLENAKTEIDSLFPVRDAVKRYVPDLTVKNIFSTPVDAVTVQAGETHDEVMIIAVLTRIAPRDENDKQNLIKRGYAVKGPHMSLNLFARDDTDEIFCKIGRYEFPQMAQAIMDRGRPGRAIYAIKGTCPKSFRMISVKAIRYICDIDGTEEELNQQAKDKEEG